MAWHLRLTFCVCAWPQAWLKVALGADWAPPGGWSLTATGSVVPARSRWPGCSYCLKSGCFCPPSCVAVWRSHGRWSWPDLRKKQCYHRWSNCEKQLYVTNTWMLQVWPAVDDRVTTRSEQKQWEENVKYTCKFKALLWHINMLQSIRHHTFHTTTTMNKWITKHHICMTFHWYCTGLKIFNLHLLLFSMTRDFEAKWKFKKQHMKTRKTISNFCCQRLLSINVYIANESWMGQY